MIPTVSEDPEHAISKKLLFCKYMEKIGDFTILVRNDARIFNISLAQESLSNFSFSYIYKQKAHTHTKCFLCSNLQANQQPLVKAAEQSVRGTGYEHALPAQVQFSEIYAVCTNPKTKSWGPRTENMNGWWEKFSVQNPGLNLCFTVRTDKAPWWLNLSFC